MINLEPICAKYGHQMIAPFPKTATKDQENVVTKALGVLAESGLYSMCIFLLSCQKKDYGGWILSKQLLNLWKEPGLNILDARVEPKPDQILDAVRKVTEDLPRLIIVRKVTEQALIFARYHAKSGVEGEDS